MGSCWPKPVRNLPSVTKLATPSSDNKGSFKPSPKNRSMYNVNVAAGSDSYASNSPVVKQSIVESAAPASPCPLPAPINTVAANGDNNNAIPASTSRSLKMFTYAELRSATKNFRPDTVLGEGGFGRVFKGWIDEKTYAPSRVGVGIPVAVKKSNPDSQQGLNEWQAEVKFLGKFCHPSLVKLLGYCWEDDHFLLVYEYMQRGSLEGHLFRKGAETLAWETRLKIAVEAARGLEFLHSTEKQVIYRDFKSSNILLDMDFNAKLSDFGLAKLGPMNGDSHVTTQVVGTYGYAAPEYMATGHLYVKSDVYGFGVVLLEILTGRAVLDVNRPSGEHNLVEWAKPLLPDKRKLRQLMDPRLEGQYPSTAATQIAELILKCLDHDPKKRPGMEQVLDALKEISTIKIKPKPKPKDPNQQPRKTRTQSQLPHPPTTRRSHDHNANNYRSPRLRSPAPPSVQPKNPSAGTLEARPHQKLPANRRYHLIREIIGRQDVKIERVPTDLNIADQLTKALSQEKFEKHVNDIGIRYMADWL